jgi:hypothetical protein
MERKILKNQLSEIGYQIKEHWTWIAAAVIIALIVAIILDIATTNWLLSMRVEGTWMQNKAGVNIWDKDFEQGIYWQMLWLIPLVWVLADPFFWRKRPTMKIVFKVFDEDINETSFTARFFVGLVLMGFRALLGFIVSLFTAHALAKQLLFVSTYLKINHIGWFDFVTKNYFGSLNFWFSGNLPNAGYLVENAVIFDFLGALWWLLVPLFVYLSIKLIIGGIYEILEKKHYTPIIRGILSVIFIWFLYFGILTVPASVADISTPIYMGLRIPTLIVFSIMLLALWLTEPKITAGRLRFGLPSIILGFILLIAFIGPPIAAWKTYQWDANWSASKNVFEFPYRDSPHISYIKWTNDLNDIEILSPENITTPVEFEEQQLQSVRIISYTAALKKMTAYYGESIGQPWMKISYEEEDGKYIYGPMTAWSTVRKHEYWVCPTAPTLPEQSDVDVAKQYLYTHAEVILAVDSATGTMVPINEVYPQLNASTLSIYYGLGGLFKSQGNVYIGIGNWNETHLKTFKGSMAYDGEPDYVFDDRPVGTKLLGWLCGNERQWNFYLSNQAFAQGKYGSSIKTIFHRDAIERIQSLLVDGLELEKEPTTGKSIPYLVVDPEGKVYLAFAIYINKGIGTGYADTNAIGDGVTTNGNFRRPFAIALLNVHDGRIEGYRYGDWDENYITQTFASYYPTWNRELPSYVEEQARFPKSLMQDIVDLYNTYKIDAKDWDSWHKTLGFYDFPVDASWNYFDIKIDDIKYIPTYFNDGFKYAGARVVEIYQQKSAQWTARPIAGTYLFLGSGKKYFVPLGDTKSIQLLLDTISLNPDIQLLITTKQKAAGERGEKWEQGSLMMCLMKGKPIFFLPYYSFGTSTMRVTMVVCIDGVNRNTGYYELSANPTPEELKVACARAYGSMTKSLLKSQQERADSIKEELRNNNLTIIEPKKVSPMISQEFAVTDFRITQQWDNVNVTLHRFIDEICLPNNIQTVYAWTEFEGPTTVLYIAVLLQPSLVMELVKINIS